MSALVAFWLIDSFAVAACLFALWKGGPAERWGAWIILANLLLYAAAVKLPPTVKPIVQLCLDATTALGLLAVALRYGSPWVGVAILLYALQFTLHAYYFVVDRPIDMFHIHLNNAGFVLVSLSLIVGTAVAWRRHVRGAPPS
jgi:hypothetical protein